MKRLWLIAPIALFAAAGPCAGPQLPGDLRDAVDGMGSAHRDAREAARDVKELKETNDELTKCDRIRTEAVAFPEEQSLGQMSALNIASEGGLVVGKSAGDAASRPTEYLNRVGLILASRSDRPSLPWWFGILADDSINAYSTPGGYVLVTRGLLKHVKNEAQLAGVLAHEIAHITNLHALGHYRKVKGDACRNAVAAQAAGEVLGGMGDLMSALNSDLAYLDLDRSDKLLESFARDFTHALTTTPFDPKQEEQADRDAVSLMIAAGYQPGEYVKLLESLPGELQSKTHPPKDARTKSVNAAIASFSDKSQDALRSSGAPFGEAEGFVAPPLPEELATLK